MLTFLLGSGCGSELTQQEKGDCGALVALETGLLLLGVCSTKRRSECSRIHPGLLCPVQSRPIQSHSFKSGQVSSGQVLQSLSLLF